MIARRRVLLGTAMLGTAWLGGCASAPTHEYRLAALPGPVNDNAAFSIRVRNIAIPGYLRGSGIAKPGGAYAFDTYPTDVWAGPLEGMLLDVTVQELASRLPGCTVVRAGGAIVAPADVVVEANVLRFDPDAEGRITLTVQMAVKGGREMTPWVVRSFTAQAQPAGTDAASAVAAMSTLWAGLMDQLAALLVAQWDAHEGGAAGQS